jgi:hypothetical protein
MDGFAAIRAVLVGRIVAALQSTFYSEEAKHG